MLFNAPLTCTCDNKFDTDRALIHHMRTCEHMYCCGRQFTNYVRFRHHQHNCPHGEFTVTGKKKENPTLTPFQPPLLICAFCKRDNFKSPTGLTNHQRRCKENPMLSQNSSEHKSVSSSINVTTDPVQNHSIPVYPGFSHSSASQKIQNRSNRKT